MSSSQPRLLIITAHPDDAEYYSGGLATLYHKLGRDVKIVSVSDGSAGHHARSREELASIRRDEAGRAGQVIESIYETLHYPDGELQPTLDLRHRLIREIRQFDPDLIVTHRTCDYHPDHQAVGQVVQDSAYLITVPHIEPDVPALTRLPVIAFMPDLFTRPARMRADVVLDATEFVSGIVAMLACHESQVFEWLPYEEGILSSVPTGDAQRKEWLRGWYEKHVRERVDHFRSDLQRAFGSERGDNLLFAEVYEISEYGSKPSQDLTEELFPQCAYPERSRANTTYYVDGIEKPAPATVSRKPRDTQYNSLSDQP